MEVDKDKTNAVVLGLMLQQFKQNYRHKYHLQWETVSYDDSLKTIGCAKQLDYNQYTTLYTADSHNIRCIYSWWSPISPKTLSIITSISIDCVKDDIH